MKAIKIIALILIIVLLVPALGLLQAGIALGGTVFSPGYFNAVFDRSFTSGSIEALAGGVSQGPGTPEALGALLGGKDGKDWLKAELPKLARGSYQYFATGTGKLPVVNIKLLKTSLIDAYVDRALAGGGEDAALLKKMVETQLGIDTMKDSLDLNALARNAYGTENNPVTGLGPMLAGVRSNLFLIIVTVVALLLALVAVVAFRPAAILRWMGAAFVISGAACLILPAAALLFNGTIKLDLMQWLGLDAASGLLFVRDWALSYINGITLFLLVESAVVLALGIVMLAVANRAGRGTRGREGNSHAGLRAVAALVLAAAIPLSLYVFGRALWVHADQYDRIVKMADRAEGRLSFGQALDKTLNSKLFGTVFK